jgi:uncharacterized protein (TIGR03083 family)
MERDRIWDHTVAARRTLAATLATLTPEEWDHLSLCDGWRVRDVAAHVILGPQLTWGRTVRLLPQFWRGYNGTIAHLGRVWGSRPVAEILAQYEQYADLRRGPALVGDVEPLIDALVHTQDIVRPLGRSVAMPPEAAAVAARRAWTLAPLMGRKSRATHRLHLVATDSDWSAGSGPTVEGPTGELLMLATGREPVWSLLSGDGVPAHSVEG